MILLDQTIVCENNIAQQQHNTPTTALNDDCIGQLYADDIMVHPCRYGCNQVGVLQCRLQWYSTWADMWRVKFNGSVSKILWISKYGDNKVFDKYVSRLTIQRNVMLHIKNIINISNQSTQARFNDMSMYTTLM